MSRWLPFPLFSISLAGMWLVLNGTVAAAHVALGAALGLAGGLVLARLQPPLGRVRWRRSTSQDRVLALDALYVTAMLLILTVGMRTGTALYFEAALVIGMLGFISTAALAKFLLRGEVIE